MSPATKEFHQALLRCLKTAVDAYEKWIKAHRGSPPSPS